jgi:hypothetical protein
VLEIENPKNRRYSPKIDAVHNTDETKVAIANSE